MYAVVTIFSLWYDVIHMLQKGGSARSTHALLENKTSYSKKGFETGSKSISVKGYRDGSAKYHGNKV